jgi:protein SCO1/2
MAMTGKLDIGTPRDPLRQARAYQAAAHAGAQAKATGLPTPRADKPMQVPFSMELERPRKTRFELQFQGETAVQVYDGEHGWKLRPFLGRSEVEPYSDDELAAASEQDQLDGILIDYAAKGSRLERVGREKVDGRDAEKIKVTLASGQGRNVWVDRERALEVKLDGVRRLDGKERPVWTFFRDYRSVDGLMIPHVLETVVDGVNGSEKIVIEHVTINPPLAASRFEKPTPRVPTAAALAPANVDPAPEPSKPKRAIRSTASYKVPTELLLREDGRPAAFPQEIDDGKPVVLNFIFTSCASICPVMSQIFSQLQDRLGSDRDKVHMVSISIDPEHDRPARLAEYAKRFHAASQWHYYTGSEAASIAMQRAFDAYRGEKMSHTPLTFLRVRPGTPWIRFDGYASPDELAGELRTMLAIR